MCAALVSVLAPAIPQRVARKLLTSLEADIYALRHP
jgi:hypothetical protein